MSDEQMTAPEESGTGRRKFLQGAAVGAEFMDVEGFDVGF